MKKFFQTCKYKTFSLYALYVISTLHRKSENPLKYIFVRMFYYQLKASSCLALRILEYLKWFIIVPKRGRNGESLTLDIDKPAVVVA